MTTSGRILVTGAGGALGGLVCSALLVLGEQGIVVHIAFSLLGAVLAMAEGVKASSARSCSCDRGSRPEGAVMMAVQIVAYGDPVDGIQPRDIPEPLPPGPGEALVATRFAPINVNDLMVVRGIYGWGPDPPETLGNEGMGAVLAVGKGVTRVAPGDQVVLPFMARSWRERLVVPAGGLVALPPDADPRQASMLAINAVTAKLLLEEFVALQPGDAVAYNAATSGLGHWVAGLAGRQGLRTVGLVRRRADVGRVRGSGCDLVIPDEDGLGTYSSELAVLRVWLALDGVGGASAGRLAELFGERGTLVAYGAASGRAMEVSAQHLIFNRLTVEGFFEGHADRVAKVVAHP
jgi:NADPH:quinone reductase-like Zn-dependent oxidoreductase